jgi:membrane fusion protein, multidrug efflux system
VISILPRTSLFFAAGVLVACQAAPDNAEAPHELASAAVVVATPVRGSLPRTVVAWGQASAGMAYQQAVSVPAEASLASLAIGAGEHVHAGQALGTVALSGPARLAIVQATTSLRTATESLARATRLKRDALVTDEQVEQATKAVEDARAALAALPAADARGRAVLRSPVDGSVASIAVSPGQVVPAGTTLMSITPSAQHVVVAGVEPRRARSVAPGMPVILSPVDGGDGMAGKVVAMGDGIDAQTRLLPVRIAPERAPLAGSAWRAEITVATATGWVVPSDALVEDSGGRWVYQVRNGKAHRVQVDVLARQGDHLAVSGEIDPARPLVVAGAPQLAEGMAVATSEGGK